MGQTVGTICRGLSITEQAEAFLAAMRDERLADGRARLVRHGHGPERTIQTGIGPVLVRFVITETNSPAVS